ncbi:MAG TPA: efflux RND transporter periplasmic adaptor subunit [Paludibaculum sp.]|jgi:RND family efflux transporter MFP subunit
MPNLTSLIPCAGALLLLAGCGGKPETAAKEQPVPVRVRQPATVERQATIHVGGNVEARESVELGFQLAGRIRRVHVEEGQQVQAGQLIAELDATDYQIGADAAVAEASAARALSDKAGAGARVQDLAQAKAAFEQADDEYRRMKTLYERKSLAPNDFRKIEAQWKVAGERFSEAREGARKEDIAAAQAKSRQADSGVRLSQKRVADTRLVSPITGVIARRLHASGEMIAAGYPVVAIIDLNPVRVKVGVPEMEISKVKTGQPARVLIPSMGGKEFAGRVELLGYAAEPQSRTFAVRLLVPNPGLLLRAGMIAEAEIQGDTRQKVITVPGEAIVRDPQGALLLYVYYPDKQRVFARRVQTGRATGTEIEITDGITANDQIVIAGQQKLREGALVQVGSAQ